MFATVLRQKRFCWNVTNWFICQILCSWLHSTSHKILIWPPCDLGSRSSRFSFGYWIIADCILRIDPLIRLTLISIYRKWIYGSMYFNHSIIFVGRLSKKPVELGRPFSQRGLLLPHYRFRKQNTECRKRRDTRMLFIETCSRLTSFSNLETQAFKNGGKTKNALVKFGLCKKI